VNSTATGTSSTTRHDLPLQDDEYDGVAVTLMLKAPKWFHRRYTIMLQNVLANLPAEPYKSSNHHPPHPPTTKGESRQPRGGGNKGWAVQIIGNLSWLKQEVFPLHPALKQLLATATTTTTTSNTGETTFKRGMVVMTFSLPSFLPP
jgi:hypothetical protein